MNPRLVICLFGAFLVGFTAAAGALWAGWHPLAAFPIFSLSGSVALVALALVAAPRRAPRPAAPVAAAEPAPA